MKWSKRQFVSYLALAALVVVIVAMGITGFFVRQKLSHNEAFVRFYPGRQLNTVWKTDENDVVFLMGDGEEELQVFALWNGDYVAAQLNCDYGQQAEIAVSANDGKDVCLVFGEYALSEDRFSIEVDEESSAADFVGTRDEIVLHRFFWNELEENGDLKEMVISMCQ